MNNLNKLWCECSAEEHREVRNWQQRFRYAKKKYKEGRYTTELFQKKLKRLKKELEEIERKYADENEEIFNNLMGNPLEQIDDMIKDIKQ